MKKTLFFLVTLALLGFSACSDDDDKVSLPDITVNFASSELGLASDSTSANVVISLSRQTDVNLDVTVSFQATGATYGTDFTTTPAAEASVLKVTVPAGTSSASFAVSKKAGADVDGGDYVKFQITAISATSGFKIGNRATSTLYFGSLFSKGDQITLNGRVGNNSYANSVYVDFSRNSQVAIDRKNWNLGFYNGNEYRVILNAADATTAIASGKTDINSVTLAEAEAVFNIAGSPLSQEGLPFSIVDDLKGSLSGTVIAEVLADDTKNQVYFVAPENSKVSRDQWYKVKVNRSANGYTVQYAKVGEATVKTVEVSKNTAYNFSFLSFDKASIVSVEPEANRWDLMWSYYTGDRGDGHAYFLQDVVLINNIGGVEAAEVLTSVVSYTNFGKQDLEKINFSSDKNVIGSTWRSTSAFDGGTIGVKTDRFYVLKDGDKNYYKLRFLKMGLNNDGGERGRPVIEYELIEN